MFRDHQFRRYRRRSVKRVIVSMGDCDIPTYPTKRYQGSWSGFFDVKVTTASMYRADDLNDSSGKLVAGTFTPADATIHNLIVKRATVASAGPFTLKDVRGEPNFVHLCIDNFYYFAG